MPYIKNRKRNLSLFIKINFKAMSIQYIIILFLLFSIGGLLIWFLSIKKAMNLLHNENMAALKSDISQNRDQIEFRKNNLCKYDFLKYNLLDALIVQPNVFL